jgi:hypothetical protein
MSVQWVHLGAREILVASSRGAWLQQPELGAFAFNQPMPPTAPGDLTTTRHLLDGAIAAAERATPPAAEPVMTPRRWAWLLVNQYYTAHHSVALLPSAIERYRSLGRADLAEFAWLKLEEEHGHDQFALADLTALGYDADAAVATVPVAPNVEAAVAHARGCVHGERPVDFVGYVYALERSVIRISEERLASLDALLPPGVDATSAVRAHALELDLGHVDEIVAFVSDLPAGDRTSIALSAHQTTAILCARTPGLHPSEEELKRWLAGVQSGRPVKPSVVNPIQEEHDE